MRCLVFLAFCLIVSCAQKKPLPLHLNTIPIFHDIDGKGGPQ